ncbi:MAG TPA: cupin domain-containing protein [Mucilaginibacter sp.]|jgi:quercetin dioxygenase-like cupin family protein
MKTTFSLRTLLILVCSLSLFYFAGFAFKQEDQSYVVNHERDIQVEQPGPHNGGGKTIAFPFFDKVKDAKMIFRKRILHPGSSIGYHPQEKQEIYYILSGNGELTVNGKIIPVTTGDAILTMPGSSHGLKPLGNKDLTMLITYEND